MKFNCDDLVTNVWNDHFYDRGFCFVDQYLTYNGRNRLFRSNTLGDGYPVTKETDAYILAHLLETAIASEDSSSFPKVLGIRYNEPGGVETHY